MLDAGLELTGFVLCLVWIFALSREVFNILSALGIGLDVDGAVLGLVVLALGNSFGDLVANVSVARSGAAPESAVVACLCSPIQNILLSLGLSLLKQLHDAGSQPVSLRPLLNPTGAPIGDLPLAFIFLIVVIVLVAALTVLAFRYQLPRYLGLVLVALYAVYLAIAIPWSLGTMQ